MARRMVGGLRRRERRRRRRRRKRKLIGYLKTNSPLQHKTSVSENADHNIKVKDLRSASYDSNIISFVLFVLLLFFSPLPSCDLSMLRVIKHLHARCCMFRSLSLSLSLSLLLVHDVITHKFCSFWVSRRHCQLDCSAGQEYWHRGDELADEDESPIHHTTRLEHSVALLLCSHLHVVCLFSFFIVERAMHWYMCGPTVYDSAHLGHASCYVRFDIIRRILEDHFRVPIIQALGLTDIDDKVIITMAHPSHPHESLVGRAYKYIYTVLYHRLLYGVSSSNAPQQNWPDALSKSFLKI